MKSMMEGKNMENMQNYKNDVIIIIATHKKYQMPSDPMYLPLLVGAEDKKDSSSNDLDSRYAKDNIGDNISYLNASFCELTGLYWAWKNLDADYKGLVHYRRYFTKKRVNAKFEDILKYEDIQEDIGKIKLFLPVKQKYFIEDLYSHYAHTHYAEHLEVTRMVIQELYPDYCKQYDKVLHRTSGYMFNMTIMESQLFDEYCKWLFDILFEIKKRINNDGLSAFQGRCYGRISEIIFNVWCEHQIETGRINRSQIKELPVMYTEKIRWGKKIIAFLSAKYLGKKYEKSF